MERIVDGSLLDDPRLAAGTLPGFYVDAIAVAEHGAAPRRDGVEGNLCTPASA